MAGTSPGTNPEDVPSSDAANANSGAGRRSEGTTPTPPWQPEAPGLNPELVAAGERLARKNEAPAKTPKPRKPLDPVKLQATVQRARERQQRQEQQEQQRKARLRKTAAISIGVTALLAGSLVAVISSSNSENEVAQVCRDESTQERVADDKCEGAHSGAGRSSHVYGWYFFARGSTIPAIGQRTSSFSGGSSTQPGGTTAVKNFKSTGGSFLKSTTKRGGFGKSGYTGKTFGG